MFGLYIRPFHESVAFWQKNKFHIFAQFVCEMLREDLKVYEEKDFTFLNFVTFPLSKLKVHANLSILLLKKPAFKT